MLGGKGIADCFHCGLPRLRIADCGLRKNSRGGLDLWCKMVADAAVGGTRNGDVVICSGSLKTCRHIGRLEKTLASAASPSIWRAWVYTVRTSWQRQARAHLMVWIAVGLVLFLTLGVALFNRMGVWDVRSLRQPRRGGLTYEEWLLYARFAPPSKPPPRASDIWARLYQQNSRTQGLPPDRQNPPPPAMLVADPVQTAVAGAFAASLENEELRRGVAVVKFTREVVFGIFATFLLPLCSLSFATEALGREREQRNLLWSLTRPVPRWAIYLGKYVALLPWCLALNLGGFAALCAAGGEPGRIAFASYWPAIVLGTLAFAALYHLMGAAFRRPAVIAILYSFFLETVMGNLPGHLKRASISFYMRSWMYDSATAFQLQPDRPLLYSPVSGFTSVMVLAGLTLVLLAVGSWWFSRAEYLDLA
jgi:ABC-2 type transport system permease protein